MVFSETPRISAAFSIDTLIMRPLSGQRLGVLGADAPIVEGLQDGRCGALSDGDEALNAALAHPSELRGRQRVAFGLGLGKVATGASFLGLPLRRLAHRSFGEQLLVE